jgi:release factor glutamine methyltransferase
MTSLIRPVEAMTSALSRAAAHPSPASGGGAGGEGTRLANLLPHLTNRLAATLQLDRREARLEARILAAHALGVERAWLIAHDRDPLSATQAAAVEALVARREAGEPVAYLLAEKEFHGRPFRVTPAVLIPRPETELLVEAALERLPADGPARILDLGTGSGAVAVSLALARPRAQVVALDASPAALAVARENARRLGAGNVAFLLSDWYAGLGVKKFDMIVSNPPYIAAADPHLAAGDLRFEPNSALASGVDGLDAIRAIVAGAAEHLEAGGWLLFEHGWDQAQACRGLLEQEGFETVVSLPDLAGIPRVCIGRCRLAGERDGRP